MLNTLYKGISKLLCRRLKAVLLEVVHLNQSAFIEGRLIGHNNMIFQDLIRSYQRKTVSPRCLFKKDLRKAYDSVSWDFISQLLSQLQFSSKFRQWILVLITTYNFSLSINGHTYGNFHRRKGLK